MANFMHEERLYWSGNATTPHSSSFIEPETISPITMAFNIIVLACGAMGITASFTLVYGLYKDKRAFLIPWIMTVVAAIVIDLAHSLYLFVLETMQFNPMTAILFTVDFFLLTLNTYCLLCVVSQYQEYKAGRGTADYENAYRVPGVRYIPQPTGTSCLSTRRAVTYHETRATPTQSPSHPATVTATTVAPLEASRLQPPLRKHVQFGGLHWSQTGPPRIESPKESESSEITGGKGGCSPVEGSLGEWTPKPVLEVVDTEPLIIEPPLASGDKSVC